jgi:hypothetical protein
LASDPFPYADNFVDLVVIAEPRGVRAAEVVRVVRPRGCALVQGDTELALEQAKAQRNFQEDFSEKSKTLGFLGWYIECWESSPPQTRRVFE